MCVRNIKEVTDFQSECQAGTWHQFSIQAAWAVYPTPPLMYLVLQIVSELVFVGPMRISKTQHNFKTQCQQCFYYFQIYPVILFNHHSVCFARIFQFYSILEK